MTAFLMAELLIIQVCKSFQGLVTCFKTNLSEFTLLARHGNGYTKPWLILTDLQSEVTDTEERIAMPVIHAVRVMCPLCTDGIPDNQAVEKVPLFLSLSTSPKKSDR